MSYRRGIRVALLVAVAVVVTSCGGEPSTEQFVESLTDARPEMSSEDAQCVVAELQNNYTNAQLAELTVPEGEESAAEAADRAVFAERQLAAVRSCDLEGQVSPGLVEAFAEANALSTESAECAIGNLQDEFGFWELTERLSSDDPSEEFARRQFRSIFECGERSAVVSQLEPQLVEQGVSAADSACVAVAVAETMQPDDLEVLFTGEMSDAFFVVYLDALETCDALPDDG